MKYWIEWKALYENFFYSEAVTEQELTERLADNSIEILSVKPLN